jgi:hypothetical protein
MNAIADSTDYIEFRCRDHDSLLDIQALGGVPNFCGTESKYRAKPMSIEICRLLPAELRGAAQTETDCRTQPVNCRQT